MQSVCTDPFHYIPTIVPFINNDRIVVIDTLCNFTTGWVATVQS